MNNQRSFFFNVDWIIVVLYLALCTIGWFNIHAAVFDERHPSIIDLDTNYGKQFLFIIISVILGVTILLLESRFIAAALTGIICNHNPAFNIGIGDWPQRRR